MQMQLGDRARGALLGLAVGDALGAPIEGLWAGQFQPVTGFAPTTRYGLQAGEWTDDTSMALCLADSLVARHGYDSYDVMDRYIRWVKEGYRSVNGVCFDVGSQTGDATRAYRRDGEVVFSDRPRDKAAGGGAVMRLAPVTIAAAAAGVTPVSADRLHQLSARETHYSAEAEAATVIFGRMLLGALGGATQEQILGSVLDSVPDPYGYVPHLRATAHRSRDEVRSGGYIKETLEAAVWAFATTTSYESAVLSAVNLGHDADTVGAVAGQLAGAFYGVRGIPHRWLTGVAEGEELVRVADQLVELRACRVIVTRFEEDPEFGPRPTEPRIESPLPADETQAPKRRWFNRR